MENKFTTPSFETRRRETSQARALLSGLSELSFRAGHDLAGPLNQAASLMNLFIRRYRDRLDSDADQLLDFLQSAAVRTEEVVAGFRKYMEIASGSRGFEPVDLNASLASALVPLNKAISESGAAIVSDSLPLVSADSTQMVTLFEVLLDNSIKFRKPGIPPRIRISSEQKGDTPVIAVEDNGIGIEPEYHEIVFLPFKRPNGRKYPGAGLGLAMAKVITGMHGGDIQVDSIPESEAGGTRVQFTVPPE